MDPQRRCIGHVFTADCMAVSRNDSWQDTDIDSNCPFYSWRHKDNPKVKLILRCVALRCVYDFDFDSDSLHKGQFYFDMFTCKRWIDFSVRTARKLLSVR